MKKEGKKGKKKTHRNILEVVSMPLYSQLATWCALAQSRRQKGWCPGGWPGLLCFCTNVRACPGSAPSPGGGTNETTEIAIKMLSIIRYRFIICLFFNFVNKSPSQQISFTEKFFKRVVWLLAYIWWMNGKKCWILYFQPLEPDINLFKICISFLVILKVLVILTGCCVVPAVKYSAFHTS